MRQSHQVKTVHRARKTRCAKGHVKGRSAKGCGRCQKAVARVAQVAVLNTFSGFALLGALGVVS
jgi:hypothetical protein